MGSWSWSEFFKLVVTGVVSGLVVLFFSMYLTDLKDYIKLGIRVDEIEKTQQQAIDDRNGFRQELNGLSIQVARMDERTKVDQYNKQALYQTSKNKNVTQPQIDSTIQYLDSKPKTNDAMNYLEMKMGFTAEEAKAVIVPPTDSLKALQKNDLKK